MKRKFFGPTVFFAVFTAIACFVALTAATYAWFTSNQTVSTSRVEGRTNSTDVRLLISTHDGANFSGAEGADIGQVNELSGGRLMPVSTADLETFVYSPATNNENMAVSFLKVENENYYYHGRVYIMAQGQNMPENSRIALYLDQSADAGGVLAQNANGLLQNAARLGLVFGNSTGNGVIFYLSEENNGSESQVRNTRIDGKVLGDGNVLTFRNNGVAAVSDPAVSLKSYSLSGDTARFPNQPLFVMELNQIYPVDVYFYLEGCDPDCSDSISFDGVDIHLAFFGVLQQ